MDPLPLAGSVLEIGTEQHVRGALVDLTSWTQPGDVYSFDPHDRTIHAQRLVAPSYAPTRAAEETTATSADGTAIPISIVHGSGMTLDGTHPLILRVAGAYGFSLTPNYGSVPEAWIANGGVYAIAHVRGGGELGEAWHRAAMGASKPSTWNDLIAVATRLIDLGYTSPSRLDLYGTTQSYLGGIASSIAIGRAIEERPDLFAAAVIDVPIFDVLRSERTELGRQSISEFGSLATPDGFDALFAMSPYEHVAPGTPYPPMLVRSFSHVGRGDDWQAAKMVARLDAAAGHDGAAFFDSPFDTGDRRSRADLQNDAFAFFSLENQARTSSPS